MKKFTIFMSAFLSILLISSTISSTMVFANDALSINESVHGEDFNWDDVEWEEIDIEYDNDEAIIFDEEFDDEEYEDIDLDEGEDYKTEFDFIIINEEDPRFKEAEFQPFIWGLIARVVLSGGKHVVKFGSKVFKKQPASKAVNHTKNFKPANVNIGNGNTVVLQRSSMNHILQRHHPNYWAGYTNKTLFNPSISSGKIRAQIIQILNKNRSKIKNGYGTINVKVEGQIYRLVVSNYRVTTFYPVR